MEPEVITDQSIEDKLAAAYAREDEANDPAPKKEPPKDTQEDPEPAKTAKEGESDPAEATDTDAVDDDSEEVEFEGELYKLPKKLKEGVLRQKDYTQKTQEVAESRRMLEEREQSLQTQAAFQQQHFAKAVEAHTLSEQLQQFARVNWEKLADENPSEAIKLHTQHMALQQKFAGIKEEMQGLNGQFGQMQAETRQKAQAQCLHELKKDFPDLSSQEKAPALLKKLDETGRQFGFTGRELEGIADPRMIRVLHAAMQWKALQASKSVVEKKVSTAKPVQVQAARTSQSNQQTAKMDEMRARLKKTGKDSDAISLLEARFARSMK